MTEAWNLPAKYCVHVVGPVWRPKYECSAKHCLESAYYNALGAAHERGLLSVTLPCIYTDQKRVPRESGAHIACRTIRRFLERFPTPLQVGL